MKKLLIAPISLVLISLLLVFSLIIMSDEEDFEGDVGGLSVSSDVLAHAPLVEKYCKEYGIMDYINYIYAIMEVESGGKGNDVMQASESLGLPVNTLNVEESIKQGVSYFSSLLNNVLSGGGDINIAVQSYNYGGGFSTYVMDIDQRYSFTHAQNFALEKSGGVTVTYSNPIAVEINGGWRYKYGNMFYVKLVEQYLYPVAFSDETVQVIMNEALKYQGYKYVFGGSTPSTSFDCSGLTQWTYKVAGINLPRTAQMQYDFMEKIPLDQAMPGDLLFFKGTYDSGTLITHCGIYVGNNQMYHAGDPIGYANIDTPYWQNAFVSAGRISK